MTTSTPGQQPADHLPSGSDPGSASAYSGEQPAYSGEKPASVSAFGGDKLELTPEEVRWGRVHRKQEKIRAEIERNREGGHRVPTWALAAVLALVVVVWIILVVTA